MECLSPHCRNKKAPRGNYCYSCVSRKYAKKHPEKYTFNNLRSNSKRRGKIFTLTFEQFLRLCTETEYMQRKGVTKFSLHLDRIEEERGYTYENLQTLENTENVKKYLAWKYRDESGKNVFTVKMGMRISKKSDDCPF